MAREKTNSKRSNMELYIPSEFTKLVDSRLSPLEHRLKQITKEAEELRAKLRGMNKEIYRLNRQLNKKK